MPILVLFLALISLIYQLSSIYRNISPDTLDPAALKMPDYQPVLGRTDLAVNMIFYRTVNTR